MLSSPHKNIDNIAVHLDFSQRKSNPNIKPNSKQKLQLKISPFTTSKYQRNLSPWNLKKNQLIPTNNEISHETNLSVASLVQKQIDFSNKNQTTTFNQDKMNDFLQKIHFTNKKNASSQSKIPPFKINKFQQNQKDKQKQSFTRDLTELTQEEIKKIIIYPKDFKKTQEKKKKKSNLKDKNKQNSVNKMASIQTFYDPYQNKTKMSKKMLKYRLKLNDQLSQAYTTRAYDSTVSHSEFGTTWRKNSIPQKNHRRNFSMPQNQIQQSNKLKVQNQKQMRRTFFKTRASSLSKNFITQPTQRNQQLKEDPQKNTPQQQSKSKSPQFQPTYATPNGQAIKRIKHQYKKSRRIKTESNNYKSEHSKSEMQTATIQNNFYLYQTFLNYKSKNDSSGMNITKTLGFNFHNQQTFKQNIQKIWLKPKN